LADTLLPENKSGVLSGDKQ